MPNTILYQAGTNEEIHNCAYSILKYLSVYNLKPPVDHALHIHTPNPASLEMYGSFFNRFELKESLSSPVTPQLLRQMMGAEENVLYLGVHTYPNKSLDPMFNDMNRGEVFISKTSALGTGQRSPDSYEIIGFNNSGSANIDNAGSQDPFFYIDKYRNLKEFNSLLKYFFKRYQEESVPNQVKLIQHIDARKIGEEKDLFQKLPFYTKLIKRVRGRAWSINQYTGKI